MPIPQAGPEIQSIREKMADSLRSLCPSPLSLSLWGISSKFLPTRGNSPILLVPLKEQFEVIKVFRVEQIGL